MPFSFKLFSFRGIPVYLKLWFFLLLTFLSPQIVLAIFISVLIHELSHAYVADKLGYYVDSIYIDFLNGAALMDLNSVPERDSIKVVAAGPLSNLILVGICGSLISMGINFKFLEILFIVNIVFFIFNILPIYPMDGGRLLKDFLFLKMSSRKTAKRISGSISLIFSCAFLVYSLLGLDVFGILFAIFFIFYSLKELDLVKINI